MTDERVILIDISEKIGSMKASVDAMGEKIDGVCDAVKKNTQWRHRITGAIAFVAAMVGFVLLWLKEWMKRGT